MKPKNDSVNILKCGQRLRVWDATLVVVAAVLSFAATLLVLEPTTVAEAEGDTLPLSTIEPKEPGEVPTLNVNGVILSVKPKESDYESGDKPLLQLTATSDTDSLREFNVKLSARSSAIPSPFSRSMVMVSDVWSHEQAVTLAPRETKTIDIETDMTVLTGMQYEFVVAVGDKGMIGTSISLASPEEIMGIPVFGEGGEQAILLRPQTKPQGA